MNPFLCIGQPRGSSTSRRHHNAPPKGFWVDVFHLMQCKPVDNTAGKPVALPCGEGGRGKKEQARRVGPYPWPATEDRVSLIESTSQGTSAAYLARDSRPVSGNSTLSDTNESVLNSSRR